MAQFLYPYGPVINIKDNNINSDSKYYPAPPYILSYYKYQNVNADKNLQKMVTEKFLDKVIYWIKNDKQYKKYKKLYKNFHSDKGYRIIYNLLRLFIKKTNANWYDLSDMEPLIKDYLEYKLNEYL